MICIKKIFRDVKFSQLFNQRNFLNSWQSHYGQVPGVFLDCSVYYQVLGEREIAAVVVGWTLAPGGVDV